MQRLVKWLMILCSLILLLIGLISFPLPIPIGLPIMLLAILLLLRYSTEAKKILLRLSRRYPLLRTKIEHLRAKGKPLEDSAQKRAD